MAMPTPDSRAQAHVVLQCVWDARGTSLNLPHDLAEPTSELRDPASQQLSARLDSGAGRLAAIP
jgi:hypothetical protein